MKRWLRVIRNIFGIGIGVRWSRELGWRWFTTNWRGEDRERLFQPRGERG